MFDAGWSSPVARQAHNLKVVGSNPTPAPNKPLKSSRISGVFLFLARKCREDIILAALIRFTKKLPARSKKKIEINEVSDPRWREAVRLQALREAAPQYQK